MQNEKINTSIINDASVERNANISDSMNLKNWYDVECYDSEGNLKWSDRVYNLVTTEGLNDALTKYFKGSSYTAAWYVGLVNGGSSPTYAAGDTAASHAGWTEVTAYSESVRQTLTLGTASAGSIDNSASKAVFSINGTATVAGCFVISNSTKSGTTGVLYGEGNFTGGNKSVASGDTLNVTVTLTAS